MLLNVITRRIKVVADDLPNFTGRIRLWNA